MSMSAVVEKDRLQRERDDLRRVLECATRIDAPGWRAERHANLWCFGRVVVTVRNGRTRRAYADITRGLSLGALVDRIKELEP
jgi:hypothetical protein